MKGTRIKDVFMKRKQIKLDASKKRGSELENNRKKLKKESSTSQVITLSFPT